MDLTARRARVRGSSRTPRRHPWHPRTPRAPPSFSSPPGGIALSVHSLRAVNSPAGVSCEFCRNRVLLWWLSRRGSPFYKILEQVANEEINLVPSWGVCCAPFTDEPRRGGRLSASRLQSDVTGASGYLILATSRLLILGVFTPSRSGVNFSDSRMVKICLQGSNRPGQPSA